jgi:hypothetical protein
MAWALDRFMLSCQGAFLPGGLGLGCQTPLKWPKVRKERCYPPRASPLQDSRTAFTPRPTHLKLETLFRKACERLPLPQDSPEINGYELVLTTRVVQLVTPRLHQVPPDGKNRSCPD